MFSKDGLGSNTEARQLRGREAGASCGSVESELFCEQELVWVQGTLLTSGDEPTHGLLLACLPQRSASRTEGP